MKKRITAALLTAIMLIGLIPSVVAQAAAINRLTGSDLAVYTALKERITDVAMGNSTSTVFDLSLEEAGLDGWFTAEDLGVESILLPNNELNPEVTTALNNLLMLDLTAIINTLLLECPYEMYWYDKTGGAEYDSGIELISGGQDPETGELYLQFLGDLAFEFRFSVAQEYATGKYAVRRTDAVAAWGYVASAEEIIDRYADASDYEKLAGYRREICALVGYNEEASKGGVAYGNPWQPVWVFDGIDGTDVVCEGYAKAFQYLCDHTDFSDKTIRCYTAWGVMWGGTGAGDHMWNIVTMDDGANYLVDVTNCDEGGIGADDLLFLKGYDSGSADTSYTYRCGDDSITYSYGEEMWSLYEPQELVLSADDYKVPGSAEFVGVSMTLDESVALHFLVRMHDTPVDGTYMEFTWGGEKYSTDSEPVLETEGAYAGMCRYTCRICAKEVLEEVSATLREVTGEPVATFSYSAGSYLARIKAIGTERESSMADAAAIYCLAAKSYFRGEAPISVSEPMEPIPTYLDSESLTSDGEISYYGQSLVMRDAMKLRLYFRAADMPTVLVDGTEITAVAHTTGGEPDGYYTVDIPILPGQIGSGFSVSLPGTAIAFTVGVGDYLAQVLEKEGGNIALKELCKAVYRYGQAAQAYLAG